MYKYKYKKVVLEGRDISVRRGGREFLIGSEFTEGMKESAI